MQDLGKLLLRIAVGGLMVFHGIDKIRNGLGFVESKLNEAGLPEWMAYGVYVGEVAAPALIVIGLFTRLSALVVAGNMAFAIYLTHLSDIDKLDAHGGWALELPAFYLLCALSIALLGAGSFSVDGRRKRAKSA